MKKELVVIFSIVIMMTACNDSSESEVIVDDKLVVEKVGEEDSILTIEDTVMIDTSSVAADSIERVDYENDLSLEIKEIEEEKENPISEDCKMFLEDYAGGIKSFASITEKVPAIIP